jgi:hypothetical protein
VLVDGHVHFHDIYALDRFLDAAVNNFREAARELVAADESPRILMMTEASEEDHFRRWSEGIEWAGWSLAEAGDGRSVVARRDDGASLYMIAGRQVQTVEGVEVLVLGDDTRYPDGRPVRVLLDRLRNVDGVPVIPWGFGKWWLRRGRLVRDLIEGEHGRHLFLADTGGRMRGSPYPSLLRAAAARNRPVLAGSDPLAFPGDERRVGSFGFELETAFDASGPALSILRALRALGATPRRFGRLEPVGTFCRNQLAMQWRKRIPGVRR